MGKRKSETSKNIQTEIGLNDYVEDPTIFVEIGPKGFTVCSPNNWNIIQQCLPFPFLPFIRIVYSNKKFSKADKPAR